MTHGFISPLPPKARVSFPLSRPHYCYAASRELELLGYAIDQATRFWESNWHTKGTGQLGALRILLQAHDKRAKLLKLLDGPPDAAEEDTQEAEPIENIGKSKAQSTNPNPAVDQPPPIDPSPFRPTQPQACAWDSPQEGEMGSQLPPDAYYDYLPEDESVIQG